MEIQCVGCVDFMEVKKKPGPKDNKFCKNCLDANARLKKKLGSYTLVDVIKLIKDKENV